MFGDVYRYDRTHHVTHKSDIYMFVLVLFEIICGKAVTNENQEEEFKLVESVIKRLKMIFNYIFYQRLSMLYNNKHM